MLKPDVSRADFRRIDDFIHDHKAILHVEFTPMTPCPGTALYEEQKDQLITRDWQVFDMQHFVVKTVLPQEEIFRMIVRSYTKVAMRIVRRKGLRLAPHAMGRLEVPHVPRPLGPARRPGPGPSGRIAVRLVPMAARRVQPAAPGLRHALANKG